MGNFSSLIKIKYLIIVIFLTTVVFPVRSNIMQDADSVIIQDSNSLKVADTVTLKIPNADSLFAADRKLKAEDLIRGERLFFGLIYLENKAVNCASCHNVRESDTLNWNPDALEIAKKFKEKSSADLNIVLLKPAGKKLSEVHNGFNLSPEDVIMIKGYMDEIADSGLRQNKPVITNLLLFIIASVLFLFSTVDLIISKKIKSLWIHYVILLVTGSFLSYILVIEGIALGRSHDYSPMQPVKFSHKVHAGQNKTDCIYCHSFAGLSKTAGIPPENVCMNCHLMVRNGTRSGTTEIAKVISAYENAKPIRWIKVHNLPDHVFFSHAQHVTAGKVACLECHGKVEEMDVVRQVSDLSMGWCINCHRTKEINFQKNKFYADYTGLSEKIKRGLIDSVTVEMIGGTECMKCHY
jgi:hypothetical protein